MIDLTLKPKRIALKVSVLIVVREFANIYCEQECAGNAKLPRHFDRAGGELALGALGNARSGFRESLH